MSRGDARVKSADDFLYVACDDIDGLLHIYTSLFYYRRFAAKTDENSYTFLSNAMVRQQKKLVLMEFRLLIFFSPSLHAVIIYCPLHRRYIDSIKEIKRLICVEKNSCDAIKREKNERSTKK
jgi:hypothetical protein